MIMPATAPLDISVFRGSSAPEFASFAAVTAGSPPVDVVMSDVLDVGGSFATAVPVVVLELVVAMTVVVAVPILLRDSMVALQGGW